MYCSIPIIFHNLPWCACVSTNSNHCHFVNGLSPLATRDSLQHCWHKLVVHDSSNCQKLKVFSLQRLSQRNDGFCGTLIALGSKLISSLSSWLMSLAFYTWSCVSSDSTRITFLSRLLTSSPSVAGASLSLLELLTFTVKVSGEAFQPVPQNFGFRRLRFPSVTSLHSPTFLLLVAFHEVSLVTSCSSCIFLEDSGFISSTADDLHDKGAKVLFVSFLLHLFHSDLHKICFFCTK